MIDKKLEENLGGVLRFIIKNFGKNSLLDSTHLSVMISELRPNLSEECAWLKEALDLGIAEVLLDKKNTNDLNRKIALNKARLIMEENHIPPKKINFILENLRYGLKWPQYIEVKDKKIEKYLLEGNSNQEEILDEPDNINENNINSQGSKENDYSLSSANKKHNYIIPLLILVFIGIIGTAIFIGLNTSQIDVTEIIFDMDYKKDEPAYVFKKGDFIIMNLTLKSDKEEKVDENNLSYVVDDTSICKVSDEFEKCRITGIGVGTTTIHVYYGNKLIENIDISFEN
ncbi:hypothetical protein [Terrisporobacter mayombei]|uniref:Ig-like domain-containing protein n=1 Tax=Terrisporobacter mayombei TaxID=1541 RepID=A0ABY9PZE1_9FIRM|nr:hypothetical protein [Terrisporobacter mayombei]MCC3868260.1 hypothetical protein [Terrisporobacter mayombei]WMT80400.1 hypothetical protein TEMA_07160 [Terrisporobacter mayombei]